MPFNSTHKLRQLIELRPQLLNVMNRFGLSFGFGEKTVAEGCRDDGVHCPSFLAVCNLVYNQPFDISDISLQALISYLQKAHLHFLEFLLPSIRKKLIEAVSADKVDEISFLLINFFDDYVAEVQRHMLHENNTVFPYIKSLLDGRGVEDFRITDYASNHQNITRKLNDLKDIFICHYRVRDNELLTSALLDIISCGDELDVHSRIENEILTPVVEALEHKLKINQNKQIGRNSSIPTYKNLSDSLSDREKEIIACIARGLSNKQIADELFLSVHTVTTHRRNIAAKLNIHSTAALTIFAIMNNLIDIRDVNLYN